MKEDLRLAILNVLSNKEMRQETIRCMNNIKDATCTPPECIISCIEWAKNIPSNNIVTSSTLCNSTLCNSTLCNSTLCN